MYVDIRHIPQFKFLPNTLISIAAVSRVPAIKPEDVEEVFFGNVLSAGYVICHTKLSLLESSLLTLHEIVSAKTQLDNAPSELDSARALLLRLSTRSALPD